MSVPTLDVAFAALKSEVGWFLGYGRDITDLTARELSDVERCVQGGLRSFYDCGYSWSFLKPVVSLALASGANTIALPDDASGIEGDAALVSGSATMYPWIRLQFISPGDVMLAENNLPGKTGPPEILCYEPLKGTTATDGQRFQIHVYPTADQAYTIRAQVYINPNYLSTSQQYAYGGAEHAQTLLEACLSEAETLLDDHMANHAAKFQERLKISEDLDRRKKPLKHGLCTDGDRDGFLLGRHDVISNPVSFYGISTADW